MTIFLFDLFIYQSSNVVSIDSVVKKFDFELIALVSIVDHRKYTEDMV